MEFVACQVGQQDDERQGDGDLEKDGNAEMAAGVSDKLAGRDGWIAEDKFLIFDVVLQEIPGDPGDVFGVDEMETGIDGKETDQPQPFFYSKNSRCGMGIGVVFVAAQDPGREKCDDLGVDRQFAQLLVEEIFTAHIMRPQCLRLGHRLVILAQDAGGRKINDFLAADRIDQVE